jgi:hypothetical protein
MYMMITIFPWAAQFTGEKKISLFLANLASYRNPLKLFLIFEYAEPDRCDACTLLIKSMVHCVNVKLVPRAKHSKQLT